MEKIEPGIYRHFKGNLYFVQGIAYDGDNPSNPSILVIYHPLYIIELRGWRWKSSKDFFSIVERENYSGPRFKKIMDWKEPNILPGCTFRDRGHQSHGLFTIKQVVEKSTDELIVEAEAINLGPINVAIEAFSLQRILLV